MAFSFFKKKKKKESNDSRYFNLTVKEVVKETKDAVSLVFEQPASGDLQYKPGQFVTLISNVSGKKIRRAYSLCTSPYVDKNPAITIKRVDGGAMSNHVNDNVKAGDVIEIMEPMGSFVLDIKPEYKKHVFLFGGGSGVTPLLSIAKSILSEEENSKVSLIYANRDEESVIFKSSIEQLQSQHPEKLSIVQFLENPPQEWTGETGFMTVEKLNEVIIKLKDPSFSDEEYMTCGPEPLMNIVMETLDQLDIPSDKKHMESFVAGTTSPSDIIDQDDLPEQSVTILLEGQEYQYVVPKGKSILEAGLDENIDMPYSCQSGLCTACRGKCLSGTVKMDEDDGLSEEEKAEGYVLLCVGHAVTDDVKVEIG
ncbi:MAG: ferredoxin--NADP reductase [Reichenbachiella sp.]